MRFLLVVACLALTSCGKKPTDIDDYEAALPGEYYCERV